MAQTAKGQKYNRISAHTRTLPSPNNEIPTGNSKNPSSPELLQGNCKLKSLYTFIDSIDTNLYTLYTFN